MSNQPTTDAILFRLAQADRAALIALLKAAYRVIQTYARPAGVAERAEVAAMLRQIEDEVQA